MKMNVIIRQFDPAAMDAGMLPTRTLEIIRKNDAFVQITDLQTFVQMTAIHAICKDGNITFELVRNGVKMEKWSIV